MAKKQQSQPRPFLKRLLIPSLCSGLLVLAAAAVYLWNLPTSLPRLEVAGFRVSEEAYRWAMFEARNDVLSDHAAAGLSLKDWSEETELGDPCRLTTERAVEILAEYYAVGTLAVERGYLADAGYEAMLRDMEYVNQERQEAIDSGAIVTGLPQFSHTDYVTYRASSLRLQFCNDPENPEYEVTDAEIRDRYEADKANLYVQPDDQELAYLMVYDTPDVAQALEPEFSALRARALEVGDLTAALEEFPALRAYYEEITVDNSTYSVYTRSHPDVLACAEDLYTGDISQLYQAEGWLCLVQCLQRTEHNYVPLTDVESIVVQSIREDRYDALIAGRMSDMEVEGDLEKLYRYTAEQLTPGT